MVDICVIGGGPSGIAAAVAARDAGAAVVLVTAPTGTARRRLELLSGRGVRLLRSLDLEQSALASAEPCDGTVSRWSGESFSEHTTMLSPDGTGWIVDRSRFDLNLVSAARERGIEIVTARVLGVDAIDGVIAGDRIVRAERIVVAAGACVGVLRDALQRTVRRRMVALGARLGPEAVDGLHRQLLIDRAVDGWWYAIGNRSCTHAVYCTDASFLGSGRAGLTAVWRSACRAAADWLPRDVADLWPTTWPATLGTNRPLPDCNIHVVGDAALSVDPLSGQGLTFALECGSRWREPGYDDFLSRRTTQCLEMERHTYRSARVSDDSEYWARRRVRATSDL